MHTKFKVVDCTRTVLACTIAAALDVDLTMGGLFVHLTTSETCVLACKVCVDIIMQSKLALFVVVDHAADEATR